MSLPELDWPKTRMSILLAALTLNVFLPLSERRLLEGKDRLTYGSCAGWRLVTDLLVDESGKSGGQLVDSFTNGSDRRRGLVVDGSIDESGKRRGPAADNLIDGSCE